MNFKQFMSFERMITPVIIKVLFWIGIVVGAISGIVSFIGALVAGINQGGFAILLGLVGGFIGGLIVFAFSILWTRLVCEMLILAFRINETLTDIKQLLKDQAK